MEKKNFLTLKAKQNITGWLFILPATLLICAMSFYPMIRAFILSFQSGIGANMKFAGFYNYQRLLEDSLFKRTLLNTVLYLILQVPVMLLLALILAALLNDKKVKFKGIFRTAIFLPCATSLV